MNNCLIHTRQTRARIEHIANLFNHFSQITHAKWAPFGVGSLCSCKVEQQQHQQQHLEAVRVLLVEWFQEQEKLCDRSVVLPSMDDFKAKKKPSVPSRRFGVSRNQKRGQSGPPPTKPFAELAMMIRCAAVDLGLWLCNMTNSMDKMKKLNVDLASTSSSSSSSSSVTSSIATSPSLPSNSLPAPSSPSPSPSPSTSLPSSISFTTLLRIIHLIIKLTSHELNAQAPVFSLASIRSLGDRLKAAQFVMTKDVQVAFDNLLKENEGTESMEVVIPPPVFRTQVILEVPIQNRGNFFGSKWHHLKTLLEDVLVGGRLNITEESPENCQMVVVAPTQDALELATAFLAKRATQVNAQRLRHQANVVAFQERLHERMLARASRRHSVKRVRSTPVYQSDKETSRDLFERHSDCNKKRNQKVPIPGAIRQSLDVSSAANYHDLKKKISKARKQNNMLCINCRQNLANGTEEVHRECCFHPGYLRLGRWTCCDGGVDTTEGCLVGEHAWRSRAPRVVEDKVRVAALV